MAAAKPKTFSTDWKSHKATKSAITRFEQAFGAEMGTKLDRKAKTVYEVFSTGSLEVDYATGIGGLPTGRIVEFWGPEAAGKSHPITTCVLTPEGWTQIGDIEVGDEVIGSDGRPTEVTHVFDRGVLDNYRVTFTDKSSVLCGQDHLWHVQTRKNIKHGSHQVLSTHQLMQRKLLNPDDGSGRYLIPKVRPIQYPEQSLPIQPYTMGVYLANGALTGGGTISTNDVHVVERMVDEGYAVGEHAQTEVCRRWYIKEMRPVLKTLGLWGKKSADKFVPEMYLRASVEQRLTLLQGLLDCDGSAAADKGTPRYFTRSLALAEGVQELIESLGGNSHVNGPVLDEDGGLDYVVSVHLPTHFEPFTTPVKADRYAQITHREPVRKIKSIEQEGADLHRCIRVAALDHLYVTEHHIVTHNTSLAILSCASAQRRYPDKMIGWVDMEQTFDTGWAEELGLDLTRVWLHTPKTAEETADAVKRFTMSGLCSVVVVDSIGGMISRVEYEKEADESTVGGVAKIVTRMVKQCAPMAKANDTTVIVVNQVRSSLSKYGPDTTTAGGWALKHVSSLKISVRRGGDSPKTVKINGEEVKVGQQVACRVEKNKVAPPGLVGSFWLFNRDTDRWGPVGVDQCVETIEVGKRVGVITGVGWLTLPGVEKPINGVPKAANYLREHPEVLETVREDVLSTLSGRTVDEEGEDPSGMVAFLDQQDQPFGDDSDDDETKAGA